MKTDNGVDVIKKWRKAKNWTRAKLAEQLGTTETSIYRWETGRHPIPTWVPKFLELLDKAPEEMSMLKELEGTAYPAGPGRFYALATAHGEIIDTLHAENPKHARQQFEALHNRRFRTGYIIAGAQMTEDISPLGEVTKLISGWTF